MTDNEIADVATYIRNAWGNKASPVTAGDVSTSAPRQSRLRRAADGAQPPVPGLFIGAAGC